MDLFAKHNSAVYILKIDRVLFSILKIEHCLPWLALFSICMFLHTLYVHAHYKLSYSPKSKTIWNLKWQPTYVTVCVCVRDKHTHTHTQRNVRAREMRKRYWPLNLAFVTPLFAITQCSDHTGTQWYIYISPNHHSSVPDQYSALPLPPLCLSLHQYIHVHTLSS